MESKIKKRKKSATLNELPLSFIDVYTGKDVDHERKMNGPDGPFDANDECKEEYYKFDGIPLSINSKYNAKHAINGKILDRRNGFHAVVSINKDKIEQGFVHRSDQLVLVYYKPRKELTQNPANTLYSVARDNELIQESPFEGTFYEEGVNIPVALEPVKYNSFKFPYSIDEDVGEPSQSVKMKYGMTSQSYHVSEGKQYSFGVELETSAGVVPTYIRPELNMKCVYDGSILDKDGNKGFGGEYVTGVLKGDNGFRHLYKITEELSKRCSVNNTCSVHVHLGGIHFSKETIVMIWKLAQMLESELFSMMPKSRLTRPHCQAIKRLPIVFNNKFPYKINIDNYFGKMFEIVSLGQKPCKTVNKLHSHPAGHSCGYDVNTPRYWWINFVPTMFNLKGVTNYTIEYRMHSATLNFTKIKNWILICMGMLYVADNFPRVLIENDKITLNQVMDLAYPKKSEYLKKYIAERKAKFQTKHATLNEKIEYVIQRPKEYREISVKDALWDY